MEKALGNANKLSPMSELAGPLRPGRRLFCSTSIAWTSVLLQVYEQPAFVEDYVSAPSPDLLVVVVLRGAYQLESFSAGSWKGASYRPGIGGVTAPHTSNRLRWHSKSTADPVLIRLYIPQEYFSEAADEYRRAGESSDILALDTLSSSDPLISSVLTSLNEAANCGAPDLYCDAAARFLVTHLLSQANKSHGHQFKRSVGAEVTDRRLLRVLEFMKSHFAISLTLDQLATEAGISRFHFSRMFKEKIGVTPHRYTVQLRMQHAERLLRETDLSIGEIALTCGYIHQGHFAASFAREFNCSPAAFRGQNPPDLRNRTFGTKIRNFGINR